MKTSIVSLLVALSFTASAGFMDSLKSVGAGIVDGAGKLADATVNATTSCVNSVTMEVAPNPTTTDETVQREKEPVQKPTKVETATDARVEKSEVQTPRVVTRQRQAAGTRERRDVRGVAPANKKTSFKSGKLGAASSNSEAEQALKLAVDYLSHDFVRQMNEIMAKDKEHTRYRRSIRSFYSHVSVQVPFNEQWQRISCSKYPEVPDLDPGDVRVPCTVAEVENWKSNVQANLKAESDYWDNFWTSREKEETAQAKLKEQREAAQAEEEKALKLAVDYLSHDFVRQMNELMEKDAKKERYRGSIRCFYSYVAIPDSVRKPWQHVHCSTYPDVPDLDPGDVRVPRTVAEFEEWKSAMQANLKVEHDYWSEKEQALKLAVDYLANDFARQMKEFMEKDERIGNGVRYRSSPRHFYSYVSISDSHAKPWQRIKCDEYPEVPDLASEDIRVPCTVGEFESWKSTMQANLKKEQDYWKKEEPKAARKNKLKDFLVKTFRPQVQVLLQAEKERYDGFSDTIWNKTWHIDEHLGHSDGEGFYVSSYECVPLVLLDWKETRCKPNDVDLWIKTAKEWLARTRKIVDRECFIDGYSLKWFAEAHGVTNIEPFKVYKDISFGDSVGTVLKKLKALNHEAKWEELSGSRFKGEVAKNIPNGKILQSVLKNHVLLFTFGSLEKDAGSALVSAKITFRNNVPERDALVEKYMALPSAKKHQEKIEVGKKWKKDEVSSFWCIFSKFAGTQLQMTALSGSGELGGMSKEEEKGLENLMKDLDAIKKDHMEGVFMDSTVIDSDVATVSVRVMADTGKVSDVIIEDKAVTALMEKTQKEFSKANAERAKKEREAAKKKAAADAVSF